MLAFRFSSWPGFLAVVLILSACGTSFAPSPTLSPEASNTPTPPLITPVPPTSTPVLESQPTATTQPTPTDSPAAVNYPQGIFGQVVASGIGTESDCSHLNTEAEIAACNQAPPDEPLSGSMPVTFINAVDDTEFNIVTETDGSYRVALPAGDYKICFGSSCIGSARVPPGLFVEGNVSVPRP